MAVGSQVTSEQFMTMPARYDANGNRIKEELIGGVLVEAPPPQQSHDITKNTVGKLLDRFLSNRPELGYVALIEIAYQVTPTDTYIADVSVVEVARVQLRGTGWISGPPVLAVEVISPTDKAADIKLKVTSYISNGAKAVWVLYPDDSSIVAYRRDSIRQFNGDQPLEDPLLPGFSSPVSALFQLA